MTVYLPERRDQRWSPRAAWIAFWRWEIHWRRDRPSAFLFHQHLIIALTIFSSPSVHSSVEALREGPLPKMRMEWDGFTRDPLPPNVSLEGFTPLQKKLHRELGPQRLFGPLTPVQHVQILTARLAYSVTETEAENWQDVNPVAATWFLSSERWQRVWEWTVKQGEYTTDWDRPALRAFAEATLRSRAL